MFEVYKIIKTAYGGNSHAVCRDEKWYTHFDKNFEDYDKAIEYIITENIKHAPPFFLGALITNKAKKSEILEEKYLYYNTHFIGKPPYNKIKKSIGDQGVKHINE